MKLPHALMPWAPFLELFPRELASSLGPIIQRLDFALGPLRGQGRIGHGEPDGFDGITRRGTYERLLISEWLLADEMPDEFSRRAAMGEHAFLELATQEPVGIRRSIALFDAGPNQLGAPRIAHIAAMIVLARRAEAKGLTLQWGVLQQPADALNASVTANSLLDLLRSRTPREATEDDVATWRALAGSHVGADDLWIIGGRRLGAFSTVNGASLLQVSDVFDPEAHCLKATVLNKGRDAVTVTLDLPEDSVCARLLRDPLGARTAELSRKGERLVFPASNLMFARGGTKLLARSIQGDLVTFPIPNSPAAGVGYPKVFKASGSHPVLAAGRAGKGFALVTATDDPEILQIECVGAKTGNTKPVRFLLPFPPGGIFDPLTPCLQLENRLGDAQWLVIIQKHLLHITVKDQPGPQVAVTRMEHVFAAGSTHSAYCFVGHDNQQRWSLMSIRDDGSTERSRQLESGLNAYFGNGASLAEPTFSFTAVEETTGQWTVHLLEGKLVLRIPAEDKVVGVVATWGPGIPGHNGTGFEPGLIMLQKDQRQILVAGRNWTQTVPRASSEIVQITASPYRPDVAYLTVQGELVVYSLQHKAVLYRLEIGVPI